MILMASTLSLSPDDDDNYIFMTFDEASKQEKKTIMTNDGSLKERLRN